MMYRVIKEKNSKDLAVIGVRPDVLQLPRVLITDGNAANGPTQFFRLDEGLKAINKQWKDIQREYWNELDGSKRKIMSECLVPESIPPEYVHSIFVADHETQATVERLVGSSSIPVIPEPNFFFRPSFKSQIGRNISLVEGDMFFSGMQTLTVSVNTQGVMGKGLASRAKYQFPDVYVNYQDACRSRKLTATKPYIYKREASLDQELADLTTPLQTPNAVKWFLLFATKRRWQQDSRIDDIEAGLDWFAKNYKSEGVASVAMPALGCGLGGLDWMHVGPLMCRYLHDIEIKVAIYLPRERGINPKYLEEGYLLR
jgi:O-acetyl-ADP-ribose deacetylase (regulator of RNase III)